ncbi:type VII secretion protein EccCa [Aldersonia sp. NBC_00410]|uniref:type VII secretion protein EccCa n=1 Tax=Aldersonia sp. NBC_00410 TaxID=2975954 RepID=UPI002254D053|nr:type VII secretion protein EccCa [Aldersonia sp. NBC_00410]MCX5046291.1 type VII secretion protein EccCa [Aldersonia sp. NBC_00410]
MATKRFQRPPQPAPAPAQRMQQVVVEPPVELPRAVPTPTWRILMPVIVMVGMGGMVLYMVRSGGGFNPMMMLFPLMMIGGMAPMFAGSMGGGGKRTSELNEDRKDFLQGLSRSRAVIHDNGRSQFEAAVYHNPAPDMLVTLIGTPRMWERISGGRAGGAWGQARIARGRTALDAAPAAPESAPVSGGNVDPLTAVVVARFVKTHSTVAGMPIRASFTDQPALGFRAVGEGLEDRVRGVVRALLCHIAVLHGPDHVLIAAVVDDDHAAVWEWCKWLPHTQHPDAVDGAGSARLVYRSVAQLREGLAAELADRAVFSTTGEQRADQRQIVIVCDSAAEDDDHALAGVAGVTWLQLDPGEDALSARRGIMYLLDPDGALAQQDPRPASVPERVGEADYLSLDAALVIARRMSAFRLTDTGTALASLVDEERHDWASLMGIEDPGHLDVAALWAPRPARERLRIVLGHEVATGHPFSLDIKDGSQTQGAVGPHGMCIGSTGSGKSEWLRTTILSLAVQHHPNVVNLLLVDFKGGSAFLGLEGLPHVTAIVTDMVEESDLVTRMKDVLEGELERRQRVLRDAGGFKDVVDYEKARARGADLEPMPALLVVIDEFIEMLKQHPDFAETFVRLGRLGRSLAVHFLMASQTFEQGPMRGLQTHMSYRIALRQNTPDDSKQVIGDPQAYYIPLNEPGHGFLRAGSSELEEFQSAYVSGDYVPAPQLGSHSTVAERARIAGYEPARLFTADAVQIDVAAEFADPAELIAVEETVAGEEPEVRTLLQTVVAQLADKAPRARAMWLPELRIPPTLDSFVPRSPVGEAVASLRFPVALLDRPRDQRQDPWAFTATGAHGHIAIVGASQSGKSTLLQTLLLSAAMTHTPEQVQFYVLDFGGGRLKAVESLPHVGSVALRGQLTRIRRTIATVKQLLERRERVFAALGVADMAEVRARVGADPGFAAQFGAEDGYGDVFFVIDGWDWGVAENNPLYEIKTEFESIATAGLALGVHLIIAASSWSSIRPGLQGQLQSRLELRLGDPKESVIDRAVAAMVPVARAGRGIGPEALHLMTVLPRLDGDRDPVSVSAATAAAVRVVAGHYEDRHAPPVRLLPDVIAPDDVFALWQAPGDGASAIERLRSIPFGVRESDLGAATIDFTESPHLLITGNRASGRSTTVRSIIRGIKESFPDPRLARFMVVDFRRQHLDTIGGEEWMIQPAYTAPSDRIRLEMDDLARSIKMPQMRGIPDGLSQTDMQERAWWTGPELFIIVDDYDLLAGRGNNTDNPLLPWLSLLPYGFDYGVHLIVARNIKDIAIAMHSDPILRAFEANMTSVVMLDGPASEGKLFDLQKPRMHPAGEADYLQPLRGNTDLIRIAKK